MSEESEDKTSVDVHLVEVQPGGRDEPGIYWSLDKELYKGPFPDQDAALEDAAQTMRAAYESILTQFLGDKIP